MVRVLYEWKNNLRKLCAVMLVGIMCVAPVMAQEQVSNDYPSAWAMEAVMEGQNYGIYPLTWHENFKAKITKAQIATLKKGISEKIQSISGVKLKENAIDEQVKGNTRGEVLRGLFLVLKNYEYPVDLGLDEIDAIEFMQKNNILSGNTKDFKLNRVCTIEEAIVFGTRITDWVYNQLDAGSKGYFWKVEGGKNDVYLFGSIHAADARLYPFTQEILEAYDTADVIGFEIDTSDEADYNKFANLALYDDGSSLKDHVSEETYDLLLSCKEAIGLTETQLNKFKVWYLSNYVSTLSLSDIREVEESQEAVEYGIDNYFFYKAYYDDKEIYPLESYEIQAKMFDSFSDELQEYLLLGNLYNLLYSEDSSEALSEEEIKAMNDQWLTLMKAGDIEGFKVYYDTSNVDLGNEVLTKEYIDKLLTNRDAKMAEKIEGCLNNETGNTYFIIVGAAHYISARDNSVIDQLKAKGYTVTQIK